MPDSRPNLLLITTDQQRFDTIQALGNGCIYTPHLNWLVDEGIAFTRCYADAPICMPSRATLMTGRCGYATGLTGNQSNLHPMADHPTLPGLLTRHGYQTRAQGKMHFHPMRCHYGFETMELPMDYYREMHRTSGGRLPKAHGVGENEVEPVISTVHETDSLTHWTVRRSIDFLETRDESRPFFLWTSFAKPHPPFDPCANYWALYQNATVPEPVTGDWSQCPEQMPQGLLRSTYTLNGMHRLSPEQRRNVRRAYYATITQIDYSLGLLFGRLRELNLLDTTWIVFTADHGDMLGDHHLGAKSVFLEGSAHVPLLVRPPRAAWTAHPQSGLRCDTLTTLADVMPTLLARAGVAAPAGLDGRDLLALADRREEGRVLFGNCEDTFFAVLRGRFKYQWCRLGGVEQLFDLATDPMEQHELVAAGTHATEVSDLRARLVAMLSERKHPAVDAGRLVASPAPKGPGDLLRWPGLHSTVVPSDVLH